MSLINEALKKAQRLRNEDAADPSALAYSGAPRASSRGKGQGANTMVLLGTAALVIVVLSVVFTVYLVNRPDKARVATAAPVAVETKTTNPPQSAEPAPQPFVVAPIVAPTIIPPPSTPIGTESVSVATTSAPISVPLTPSPRPAAPETNAVSTPAATTLVASAPPPAVSTTAAAQPPPPAPVLAPDAPDERVTAFVEAVRVTGIRSSGADSRVLMNERVYRVNDIVERTLGVKLVKATAESLTFTDSRGITYEKRF
jgi:hypothetical protein